MPVRLLRETVAGIPLHGMEFGDHDRVVLHCHGSWGNFYYHPFIPILAAAYDEVGWRCASVNLPSHDDGSTTETLRDSLDAIEVWIDRLARPGAGLILQGHSLGALKVLALAGRRPLDAVVLLSPADIVAFMGGSDAVERERRRSVVAGLPPDAMVPREVFDRWPVTASTYLAMTAAGREWDLVPSRNLPACAAALAAVAVPCFVALGGADYASTPDPTTIETALTATVHFDPTAPHDFAAHEPAPAGALRTFLSTLTIQRSSIG